MPRRVSLPGAAELFRPTTSAPTTAASSTSAPTTEAPSAEVPEPTDREPGDRRRHLTASNRGTGRIRHDEKITVYVSPDELLALEQARLHLRARHDLAVDRGRIVREAIATALADLDARGGDSDLVRRLTAS